MTLSFTFFLPLFLLQVLTLYFVVCLTTDMRRHDARLDRVGKTVDGLAHRVHMLQDGAEMAVRRLDDVTQAVKDMDGGLEALGRQLGTPVVPGAPDIMGRGFLPDEKHGTVDIADIGKLSVGELLESCVTGPDGYFVPRSQYPGTTPHVTFAEGGGHD